MEGDFSSANRILDQCPSIQDCWNQSVNNNPSKFYLNGKKEKISYVKSDDAAATASFQQNSSINSNVRMPLCSRPISNHASLSLPPRYRMWKTWDRLSCNCLSGDFVLPNTSENPPLFFSNGQASQQTNHRRCLFRGSNLRATMPSSLKLYSNTDDDRTNDTDVASFIRRAEERLEKQHNLLSVIKDVVDSQPEQTPLRTFFCPRTMRTKIERLSHYNLHGYHHHDSLSQCPNYFSNTSERLIWENARLRGQTKNQENQICSLLQENNKFRYVLRRLAVALGFGALTSYGKGSLLTSAIPSGIIQQNMLDSLKKNKGTCNCFTQFPWRKLNIASHNFFASPVVHTKPFENLLSPYQDKEKIGSSGSLTSLLPQQKDDVERHYPLSSVPAFIYEAEHFQSFSVCSTTPAATVSCYETETEDMIQKYNKNSTNDISTSMKLCRMNSSPISFMANCLYHDNSFCCRRKPVLNKSQWCYISRPPLYRNLTRCNNNSISLPPLSKSKQYARLNCIRNVSITTLQTSNKKQLCQQKNNFIKINSSSHQDNLKNHKVLHHPSSLFLSRTPLLYLNQNHENQFSIVLRRHTCINSFIQSETTTIIKTQKLSKAPLFQHYNHLLNKNTFLKITKNVVSLSIKPPHHTYTRQSFIGCTIITKSEKKQQQDVVIGFSEINRTLRNENLSKQNLYEEAIKPIKKQVPVTMIFPDQTVNDDIKFINDHHTLFKKADVSRHIYNPFLKNNTIKCDHINDDNQYDDSYIKINNYGSSYRMPKKRYTSNLLRKE